MPKRDAPGGLPIALHLVTTVHALWHGEGRAVGAARRTSPNPRPRGSQAAGAGTTRRFRNRTALALAVIACGERTRAGASMRSRRQLCISEALPRRLSHLESTPSIVGRQGC